MVIRKEKRDTNYRIGLKYSNFLDTTSFFFKTYLPNEEIDNDLEFILKRYEVQRCDALAHHPDKLEKRKQYLKDTKELILEKKKRL